MKKFLFTALFIVAAVMLSSCSASRKLAKIAESETEVSIPLSGPEYSTDENYWRVTQLGSSKDMSMAKKIAMQNARQELAALVQSQIKLVIENYGQNVALDKNNTNESLYEELGRTVVVQSLVGAELAGEKMFKLGTGSYRYHVCLQMSKKALQNSLEDKLSEDEKLKVEFDRERFKKIFEEEMAKFANPQK